MRFISILKSDHMIVLNPPFDQLLPFSFSLSLNNGSYRHTIAPRGLRTGAVFLTHNLKLY